jgi:hypothetical protein
MPTDAGGVRMVWDHVVVPIPWDASIWDVDKAAGLEQPAVEAEMVMINKMR